MIIGIDAGNNEVKVAGPLGLDIFPSAIGEYVDRNLESAHGKDDMIFEYNGRRGFAGTLAIESDFGGSIKGDSKAHEDVLIRILLAIHRYGASNNYEIIVGQPIGTHNPTEKKKIKEMVLGKHTIKVNEEERRFTISRCEVAAEGGAAFWSAPFDGLVRLIDVGSATVNCASLLNKKYLNKGSFTIPIGMETVTTNEINEIARGIYAKTSEKWQSKDNILLVGGAAEKLIEPIRKYYSNASLIKPSIQEGSGVKIVRPIYANAIGFYKIGRVQYGS